MNEVTPKTVWGPYTKYLSKEDRDALIKKVYLLAMAGKSNRQICGELLIKSSTLQLWKRNLRKAGHNLPVSPGRPRFELPDLASQN